MTLDDDVVAAARRGEPDGVRGVWEALAPQVQGYLRSRGVRDPEAVTSDVFVALLPKLPVVEGGAAGLRRLVFTIAHARMVDDLRAGAAAPPQVPYEPERDTRAEASAEDVAAVRLGTQRVLAVLAQVPEDQREVLTLRLVAGLSLDQVAEIMGRSTGAVKQLQRRGMLVLRELLTDRQVTR